MQKKSWNFNYKLYSFGWRMLQSQDETLSSKSVDLFNRKSFKYCALYLYIKIHLALSSLGFFSTTRAGKSL